jgi:hypothetical protein
MRYPAAIQTAANTTAQPTTGIAAPAGASVTVSRPTDAAAHMAAPGPTGATTTAPTAAAAPAAASAYAPAPSARCGYRWRPGDCLANYCTNAKVWAEHTATPEFAAAFMAIIADHTLTNDARDAQVEEFLLQEATKVGVVKVSHARRPFTNPNKWDKHLAPWFTT